jgi:hypothetical protein
MRHPEADPLAAGRAPRAASLATRRNNNTPVKTGG